MNSVHEPRACCRAPRACCAPRAPAAARPACRALRLPRACQLLRAYPHPCACRPARPSTLALRDPARPAQRAPARACRIVALAAVSWALAARQPGRIAGTVPCTPSQPRYNTLCVLRYKFFLTSLAACCNTIHCIATQLSSSPSCNTISTLLQYNPSIYKLHSLQYETVLQHNFFFFTIYLGSNPKTTMPKNFFFSLLLLFSYS